VEIRASYDFVCPSSVGPSTCGVVASYDVAILVGIEHLIFY
jgi:hypothetical protein